MRKIGIKYFLIYGIVVFSLAWILISRCYDPDQTNTRKERSVVEVRRNIQQAAREDKAVIKSISNINRLSEVALPDEHARKNTSMLRRDVKIVVGIPTIRRPKATAYLNQTLDSLLKNRLSFDRVVFVVYIAEIDETWRNKIDTEIRWNYAEFIASGLIHIIHPIENMYPDWDTDMKITLGDPHHQVKWRSKQNIDQAYLMGYAYTLQPKYYLSVEDDVTAVPDYLEIIFQHAETNWKEEIIIISYCKWGAIGKLFHVTMLPTIAQYLRAMWNYKPLDWLFSDLLKIIACRYPPKHCEEDINAIKIDFSKQLFEHHGKVSSLDKNKTT